jgi:ribosomal protein L37E
MLEPVSVTRRSNTPDADGTRSHSGRGDVTAVLTTPQLTTAERCDRCGAQAYVRVLLASGGELLFCAHHGREHSAKLREVATEIQDETERLTATGEH